MSIFPMIFSLLTSWSFCSSSWAPSCAWASPVSSTRSAATPSGSRNSSGKYGTLPLYTWDEDGWVLRKPVSCLFKIFWTSKQCFGSVFIFSGSGSGSRGWGWRPIRIRIRIRIRIQSGSKTLMSKNWKKIKAEKKINFFFDQKLQFTYP